MTNETAIFTITTMAFFLVYETELDDKTKEEIKEASKMAIKAIKKQMPKKPQKNDSTICQNCNSKWNYGKPYTSYCCHCGQHIDWSDCE